VNAKVAVAHGAGEEQRKVWLKNKQEQQERRKSLLSELLDDVLPESLPATAASDENSGAVASSSPAASETTGEEVPTEGEDGVGGIVDEIAELSVSEEQVGDAAGPRTLTAREQREEEAKAQLQFTLDDQELALIKSKHVRSEYFNAGAAATLSNVLLLGLFVHRCSSFPPPPPSPLCRIEANP
jgi:DNA helicase HerA-like ATPase